eukprot:SAG31_NODE_12217_length_958_cov_0.966240_1_plen_39_part_10
MLLATGVRDLSAYLPPLRAPTRPPNLARPMRRAAAACAP